MYSVGQTIYAFIKKKKLIIPVKIVEEITIKNLESEITNYKVLLPNKNREKIDLDKFDSVYNTLEDATEFMYKNAKEAIDELALKALDLESEFFSNETESKKLDTCKNDKNKVKIDLGDGTSANIDINSIEDIKEKINEESTTT
jgi:hypothetical protein